MIKVITDPNVLCQVLIHHNSGVPKIWIAVDNAGSHAMPHRVWGSLKRGGLQARESSLTDNTRTIQEKLAKGYFGVWVGNSAKHTWFAVEQLVVAFLRGTPFTDADGFQLGRETAKHLADYDLGIALQKTSLAGFHQTAGNPFQVQRLRPQAAPPVRVMGKDDILQGVTASIGRSYAW